MQEKSTTDTSVYDVTLAKHLAAGEFHAFNQFAGNLLKDGVA